MTDRKLINEALENINAYYATGFEENIDNAKEILLSINTRPQDTESNSAEWVAVSETNPIYQQAIDTWGIQSQVSMAQGECGELIAALTQFFVQGKTDRAKVIDEVADVEIMCSQLRCLFSDVEVDKRKAEKLERLQGILNGSVTHAHTPTEDK